MNDIGLEKMKICIISDFFWPIALGGAETYLVRFVNELLKKNEVIIITINPLSYNLLSYENKNRLKIYRIKVNSFFSLESFSSQSVFNRFLWQLLNIYNFKTKYKIKKILLKENPDIVHTHNFKGLSISFFPIIKKLGFPHIHTVHDYNLISPWSNLIRNSKIINDFNFIDGLYIHFMHFLSSNIDLTIFPSFFAKEYHKNQGFFKKTIKVVIPNGLRLNHRMNTSYNIDTIDYLFIGTLSEFKGINFLINVFKHNTNKNNRLHIVGLGPDYQKVVKITKNDERISVYGRVSDEKLLKIFCNSNVLVVPSLWYEVLPMVIQEAFSYGLPVIASGFGGMLDLVINDYNGFLFAKGNFTELNAIFKRIDSDPSILIRLGKNAKQFVTKYSIKSHVKHILDLYAIFTVENII